MHPILKEEIKKSLLTAARNNDRTKVLFLLPFVLEGNEHDAAYVDRLVHAAFKNKSLQAQIREVAKQPYDVVSTLFNNELAFPELRIALLSEEEITQLAEQNNTDPSLQSLAEFIDDDTCYEGKFYWMAIDIKVWAQHVLKGILLSSPLPLEHVSQVAAKIAEGTCNIAGVQGSTVIERAFAWAAHNGEVNRLHYGIHFLNHPFLDLNGEGISEVLTETLDATYLKYLAKMPATKSFTLCDMGEFWERDESLVEDPQLGERLLATLQLCRDGRYEKESLREAFENLSQYVSAPTALVLYQALEEVKSTMQENNARYMEHCDEQNEKGVEFWLHRKDVLDLHAIVHDKELRANLFFYASPYIVRLTLAFLPLSQWPDLQEVLKEVRKEVANAEPHPDWDNASFEYIKSLAELQAEKKLEHSIEYAELKALQKVSLQHPLDHLHNLGRAKALLQHYLDTASASQMDCSDPVTDLMEAFNILKIDTLLAQGACAQASNENNNNTVTRSKRFAAEEVETQCKKPARQEGMYFS